MIARVAFKNIISKPLNALLSLILLGSSICIISLIILIQEQFEKKFSDNIKGIDLVMGSSGSPLQLVLSAVYQIDAPTGNIKLTEAERWMKNPMVEKAIPLAYGDNYHGFRIIGTTPSYIEHYGSKVTEGKLFKNNFEVVIGNEVANKLKLKPGDKFKGMHGVSGEDDLHNQDYTVTGILQKSNNVIDYVILCNIESVWNIHEENHEHAEGEEHHHDEKEITAVIFKFKNKMATLLLPRQVKENSNMIMASPVLEINRLFSLFGIGIEVITYVGLGIMTISFLSIFIALYNTLKDRKYEMALIRVSGASRFQLVKLVMYESLFLTFTGYFAGIISSRLFLYLISVTASGEYHISFEWATYNITSEGKLFIFTLFCGILSALLPALQAFYLNISKTLSNEN